MTSKIQVPRSMDGQYPLSRGPLQSAPPTFHSMPSFLEYVGEGHEGLLGYYNRIKSYDSLSRFAQMRLPMVQDAYEKLNSNIDILK